MNSYSIFLLEGHFTSIGRTPICPQSWAVLFFIRWAIVFLLGNIVGWNTPTKLQQLQSINNYKASTMMIQSFFSSFRMDKPSVNCRDAILLYQKLRLPDSTQLKISVPIELFLSRHARTKIYYYINISEWPGFEPSTLSTTKKSWDWCSRPLDHHGPVIKNKGKKDI